MNAEYHEYNGEMSRAFREAGDPYGVEEPSFLRPNMTLREYYVGQLLVGAAMEYTEQEDRLFYDELVLRAVEIADIMVARLNFSQGGSNNERQ